MHAQAVASELLAFQLLLLLLEAPSEDSVELAVEFTKEVGQLLQDNAPEALRGMFDTFRNVLHNGDIGKRAQYIVEGLYTILRKGFGASGFPVSREPSRRARQPASQPAAALRSLPARRMLAGLANVAGCRADSGYSCTAA